MPLFLPDSVKLSPLLIIQPAINFGPLNTDSLVPNSPCFNKMIQSGSEFCAFKANGDLSKLSKESPCKTKNCAPKFTGMTLSIPSLPSPSTSTLIPGLSQRPWLSYSNLPLLICAYLGSDDLAWLSHLSSSRVWPQPCPYVQSHSSPLGIDHLKPHYRTHNGTTAQHQHTSLWAMLPHLAPGSTISFTYRILPSRTRHYGGLKPRWVPPGAVPFSEEA